MKNITEQVVIAAGFGNAAKTQFTAAICSVFYFFLVSAEWMDLFINDMVVCWVLQLLI